jgi:curved DNA-binding protein CbpA
MSESPARRTYYTDLGVPPDASRKDVERALWLWGERGRSGRAAKEDVIRAETAYLTLSDSARRHSYDRLVGLWRHPAWSGVSRSASRAARESFRLCQAHLDGGNEKGALQRARRAVHLDPRCALYRSTLGFLMARTGGCLRRAARLGLLAYEQNPGERRIALNLASIYERAGLHRRARRLRRGHGRKLPFLFNPRP